MKTTILIIFLLSSIFAEAKKSGSMKKNQDVCSYVKQLQKKKTLAENFIGPTNSIDGDGLKNKFSDSSIAKIQEKMSFDNGAVFLTETDFDNDNITDYIFETSEGTAHCGELALFHGEKKSTIEEVKLNYPDECLTASIIRFEFKRYLLITHNDRLSVQSFAKGNLVENCDL